ncbi:MAG: PAS domain-containing protein [Thermodesulfobacteriota bacterium]
MAPTPNDGGKWTKEVLTGWIRENLFDVVPMAIAVIDQDYNLIHANKAFEQMFGAWQGRKCHAVYKDRDSMCPDCKGSAAFKDGVPRINEEIGYNKNGRLTRYIKHTIPVVDKSGHIPFLVEMATDVTEFEQVRREHQLLFDQVPCSIIIIDRHFNIVKANQRTRDLLGDVEGRRCYDILKSKGDVCGDCTARKTFIDGGVHTGHSVVNSRDGRTIHFHVTTVPLNMVDGKFDLVMEMAVDVTQILHLEDELNIANSFMASMIATSLDAIIATGEQGNVTIFNPAAKRLFNVGPEKRVDQRELDVMLPAGFLNRVYSEADPVYLPEATVRSIDGQPIFVRLAGMKLKVDHRLMGMAFWVQDLREIKRLEAEKFEAERLAAVGQTVAGLAHGVKNLLNGLEGGMYMLSSGMKKGDAERLATGIDMLERNIAKISRFVKEFLSFSKGRKIKAAMVDPAAMAKEVVDLYSVKAKELGIALIYEPHGRIQEAALDSQGMQECLANLVGNAIDACMMSDKDRPCHVWVKVHEQNRVLVYEVVDDGCGMDYEVKQKVFTNFFTTKGLGGTGLGLLTTKKIVQEHGGTITMESELHRGTTFRINLPRHRLPKLSDDGADTN